MKKLIIADVKSYNNNGKSTGHYFAVAQNYLDLYKDCCEVKVAGGSIFKTHFKPKDIFLLPYDYIPSMNWLKNKFRVLMNCRYLFRHVTADDVIVMQHSGASTTLIGIALFATKKNNINLIQYDTDALSSLSKRIIFKLAKHRIKSILCPNQNIADAYGLPSCIVTDYIYPKDGYKNSILFEKKKYDIAIVGSICPDKGVIEAARTLVKTNYRVIIAGKANKQLADELHKICDRSENIELNIGFIKNEDYYEYIRNARFCVLNYHGVYEYRSSGVVLDILFNGTPIIGHKCKALNFISTSNVGYLFDNINNVNFDDIIKKEMYENYQKGIETYLNTQKKYKQNIVNFLHLVHK